MRYRSGRREIGHVRVCNCEYETEEEESYYCCEGGRCGRGQGGGRGLVSHRGEFGMKNLPESMLAEPVFFLG